MQRKLQLTYFKLIFEAYNVEYKIFYFDWLQYYFSSVFQSYKFELKLF